MRWDEVRTSFPEQWVVVEALEAHSFGGKRVIEDLAVLAAFPQSGRAMRRQLEIHRAQPACEVLAAFTGWRNLEIEEIHWAGIRRARLISSCTAPVYGHPSRSLPHAEDRPDELHVVDEAS